MKYPISFAIRINEGMKAMLNDLAAAEGDRPSDAEVARRLIRRAYEAIEKRKVPVTRHAVKSRGNAPTRKGQ